MMGYPQFNVGHRENLGTWVTGSRDGAHIIGLVGNFTGNTPHIEWKKNMEDGAPQIWSLVQKNHGK